MLISGQLKGLLFILTADFLWGFAAAVAKYLFNKQINPFDLVQMRIILSFILLAASLAVFNPGLLKIDRRDITYMVILGVFGVATVQFALYYTISKTNVATAVFLEYLAPVFILLYGLATRKETIAALKILALASATLGGLLIVKGAPGQGMTVTVPGLISGLGSAIAFAFYTLYGKYGLSRYSPWTLMLWGLGVAGAVWALYRPPWVTFFSYGGGDRLFFIYIAVFATILPFVFYFMGLKYLSPLVTGVTSTMEPVMAGIMSYLLLGEVLTPAQIAGCGLIVAAVLLLQQRTKPRLKAPRKTPGEQPPPAGSEQ
ncbi:MAG: DMT family transporter [Peptococcaceae bacterium]|nr:DMT family transporter [Peptococcaceae bacterium]